jgi:hypothetical protein
VVVTEGFAIVVVWVCVCVRVSVFCGYICYSMRAIAFWRIFMLHIGKRKSTEYIINIVGTFVLKENIMFK